MVPESARDDPTEDHRRGDLPVVALVASNSQTVQKTTFIPTSRQRVMLVTVTIVLFLSFSLTGTVNAQTAGSITVKSSSITSEFPMGFRIKLVAQSENEIESVAIRLVIGQQTRGGYDYLETDQNGDLIDGELLWRTNTNSMYVPPGTVISYNFEIVDIEGNRLDTERSQFTYHDPRFEWSEISQGPITLAYHGNVVDRAHDILDTIVETLDRVAPLLGADKEEPLRVTVYNTWDEMQGAIQRSSATIGQHLITEGQAFSNVGTLLVLGTRSAIGTASHEVTHIIVHRAGEGIIRKVPSWLHEGLAEYGNVDPGRSYDSALDQGIRRDRLLPVTHMDSLPGRANDVLLFYGQSKAIVRMMIDDFGTEKMRDFMSRYKSGASMDNALSETYGFDRAGLENRWRNLVGASPYVSPFTDGERPTPLPVQSRLPYTLQPHPDGEFIGSSDGMQNSGQTTGLNPTATVMQAPTKVPDTRVPLVFALPTASGASAPDSEDSVSEEGDKTNLAPAPGASCGAAIHGGVIDLSVAVMLVGLVALRVGARRRRPLSEQIPQAGRRQ